jgi:hypothetical protein
MPSHICPSSPSRRGWPARSTRCLRLDRLRYVYSVGHCAALEIAVAARIYLSPSSGLGLVGRA